MHDPISDLIIRIKNAQARKHPSVRIPLSKVKQAIASVLLDSGYIAGVKVVEDKPTSFLELALKYEGSTPAINSFVRVSKSGNRVYKGLENLPRPLSGHGLVILSTPKGIMSGSAAVKKNVGGEVIATVW